MKSKLGSPVVNMAMLPTVVLGPMEKVSVCVVVVEPTASEPKFKAAGEIIVPAGGVTWMPLVVATRLFTESVAVMVCVPIVFKVAEKVPVPLVRVLLPGRIALGSELVKTSVPL